MADGSTFQSPKLTFLGERNRFSEIMAGLERACSVGRAGYVPHYVPVGDGVSGLQDSIAEANAYRLRTEDL
jgi:hypothetical protein